MIFGIKEKSIILTPYNVFLAIATIIPQRLKTGFVVQGHIYPLRKCNTALRAMLRSTNKNIHSIYVKYLLR